MFSAFSQYLPSALQNTIAAPLVHHPQPETQELPPQSNFDPTTDDEGDEDGLLERAGREQERRLESDDDRRKPKSKKEKMANETLIFVRPPPSKSNHPLNLQVQLVPPNGRAPSGIAPVADTPVTPTSASSVGTTSSEGGRSAVSVSRSMSTRSTESNYSTNHSSNSTTSFSSMTTDASGASSATSSTSGRNPRRIIPLYNLQAHNVMTNTIVDAGTDAKIARFQKRGLELIDLAVLEPVEVWGVRNKEARREGMMISVDEMGSIVHSPPANRSSLPTGKAFLQPNPPRQSSRPGTPSGNSSAVSLHTNSTHVSHTRPQLLISPPRDPPASAPPISGTFPSSQLPKTDATSRQATSPELTSPPTKKSGASSLFGKLKFNSKRSSIISPATSPIAEVPSQPSSPTPAAAVEPSDFADFGMAPLAPGDLNSRPVSTVGAKPAVPSKAPTPSPLSLSPPQSATPTPSPATPKPTAEGSRDPSEPASPTPTVAPTRPGTITHGRNLSLTGALSRGKNKLIGGTKPPSNPDTPDTSTPSPPLGGARGFFNKLSAGITGNQSNNSNNNISSNGTPTLEPAATSSSLFPSRGPKPSRTSIDSSTTNGSGISGIKNKFDRILQHSGSQQFANGGTGTPRASVDLPSVAAPALQASSSQSQLAGAAPAGAQGHVTLRQLQLRPPVLGLQPTYVSASMPHALPNQQPSTVSLNSQTQPLQGSEDQANNFLRDIESKSSLLTGTTEGTTEESFPASSLMGKRRPGSRSTSARNSLNLERDPPILVTAPTLTPSAAAALPPPVPGAAQVVIGGKEKALMYVWLVRKWLKKREGGPSGPLAGFTIPFAGHNHGGGASESNSKSGGLFSGLVNRERREVTDGGASGGASAGAAGKRGSWHAGAAVGGISPFVAGGSHSHQPSMSAGANGGFVLSPIVGGGIEVRFEWKRAKAKKEKKSKRKDKEKEKTKDGKGKLPELKARDMARERTETPETRTVPLPDTDDTPRPADVPILGGRKITDSPRKMDRGRRSARESMASLNSTGLSRSSSTKSRKSEASPGGINLDASVKSKRRVSLRLKGLDKDDEDCEDDGDESDAEDSETPWVCTLKIRKLGAGAVGVSSGGGPPEAHGYLSPRNNNNSGSLENVDVAQEKEQMMRLKVGTLSQTPHHPKVVAMLKIPFPLPDVEVERMGIVPRKANGVPGPSSASLSSTGSDREAYKGLILTAEEIKDIVCSTGLWVAVREGFGGVGKVNRKGDGWKIRG